MIISQDLELDDKGFLQKERYINAFEFLFNEELPYSTKQLIYRLPKCCRHSGKTTILNEMSNLIQLIYPQYVNIIWITDAPALDYVGTDVYRPENADRLFGHSNTDTIFIFDEVDVYSEVFKKFSKKVTGHYIAFGFGY